MGVSPLWLQKNKKKGKDEKYGSELTTPENSSSPGMMDLHGEQSHRLSARVQWVLLNVQLF